MKLFNYFVLVSLFFKTMLVSLSAQHIELGFTSKASAGSLYGPVYRAQPIIKWGENFQNLRTVKLDRTYLHYSQFGGNRYGSASLGGFLGLERRKNLTKDFFFFMDLNWADILPRQDLSCPFSLGRDTNWGYLFE